jgi:hypothetical protein
MSSPILVPRKEETRFSRVFSASTIFSIILLPCICFLLAGTKAFDDVFIVLWSGKMLGQSWWFLNYNFEHQEMASSILGVVLSWLAFCIAPDAQYLLNKLMCLAAALATLIVCVLMRRLFFSNTVWFGISIAIIPTVLSPVFFHWAIIGLEQPFYALLILLYALTVIRLLTKYSHVINVFLTVVLILLMLVRPENMWIVLFHVAMITLFPGVRRRGLLIAPSIIAALFLAGLFLFRWTNFGYFFPNPVYAKSSIIQDPVRTILDGLGYLSGYYFYTILGVLHLCALTYAIGCWLVLFFIGGRAEFAVKYRVDLVLGAILIGYVISVVIMGGDWMMYHRFLMPMVLFNNIILSTVIIRQMEARGSSETKRFLAFAVIIFVSLHNIYSPSRELMLHNKAKNYPYLGMTFNLSDLLSVDLSALNRDWLNQSYVYHRDRFMRLFIEEHFTKVLARSKHLTILTNQAGLLPMYIRDLYPRENARISFIDPHGLINLDIARLAVPKNQLGNIGGGSLASILLDTNNPISEHILQNKPNLVYILQQLEENDRDALKAKGYELVWDRPQVVFLFKDY